MTWISDEESRSGDRNEHARQSLDRRISLPALRSRGTARAALPNRSVVLALLPPLFHDRCLRPKCLRRISREALRGSVVRPDDGKEKAPIGYGRSFVVETSATRGRALAAVREKPFDAS